MIKAVFMSQDLNRELIKSVYSKESINRICEYAEIFDKLINKENMELNMDYLRDVEIVFTTWGMPALSKEEIEEYLPKLKAVFYAAGSVQYFARPFLERNIIIASAWAANAVPVAEYTAAQILLANKGFFQNALKAKADYGSAKRYSETFPGNYSAKVGILGAGMIGTNVINLLKPFNIKVLAYDPFLSDDRAEQLGVIKSTLAEIFSQCQTISNHIANLPSTQGMLDNELFDKMLPNATFINTGRGAQIVEGDLIKALKGVPSRTAVLDVTDPEPPAPESELLKMENVFITTHIAGSMSYELERMGCYMVDEFVSYINKKELKYGVTMKMLETMA